MRIKRLQRNNCFSMIKKILKQSLLFLLFMLELFISKFQFLIQDQHKIRALFSFCICFWIQHLFNSIQFFKKCCENFIANTQANDIIASGSVTKSCKCITKGLETLEFLNFHDYTINVLKLVLAIFYQIFIFSPTDSPYKTMKNVFYFM